MKVFLTPCETERARGGRIPVAPTPRRCIDPPVHELVSSPEQADIIIITDLREEKLLLQPAGQPLLERHPDKCFVCDRSDLPIGFVRGIYASPLASSFRALPNRFYLVAVSECESIVSADTRTRGEGSPVLLRGRNSAPVRSELFEQDFARSDVLIIDASSSTTTGTIEPTRADNQRRYVETSARSRFVLCPRGTGSSSERLFEIMEMGLVPVILRMAGAPWRPEMECLLLTVPDASAKSRPDPAGLR